MERKNMLAPSSVYWIVFTQGKTHWITKWLRPNFSHIYLVTRDDYNWILLNPTRLFLQVAIPATPVTDNYPLSLLGMNDTCIKIEFTKRDDTQQYGSVGMLNCVTWAKYMLGLRVSACTPWRLFERLINFKPHDYDRHGIKSIERVKG